MPKYTISKHGLQKWFETELDVQSQIAFTNLKQLSSFTKHSWVYLTNLQKINAIN
jgi:hypothetical protein